jgi:hypothetical protein
MGGDTRKRRNVAANTIEQRRMQLCDNWQINSVLVHLIRERVAKDKIKPISEW